MKIGIIGSCLSNLPATFLMSEYGFDRLNNVAIPRSDHFVEIFINGERNIPPLAEMAELIGVPDDDPRDGRRYLLEMYKEHAGMTEIALSRPRFIENLEAKRFDVLLLDNLTDVNNRYYVYKGGKFPRFRFSFPAPLSMRQEEIFNGDVLDVSGVMDTEQSVANWVEIIKYVRSYQPDLKIIFTCAQYCTSYAEPERMDRAIEFYDQFRKIAGNLDIYLIPPVTVAPALTKLPEDWQHLDMKVYKGLAGHMYVSLNAGVTRIFQSQSAGIADLVVKREEAATVEKKWMPNAALRQVVADELGIPVANVSEESAAYETENWDSLKQISVMTAVEKAFGINIAFSETMEANSVKEIRKVIERHGVIAIDDLEKSSNLFASVVTRAFDQPDSRYTLFVKNGIATELTYRRVIGKAAGLIRQLPDLPKGSVVVLVLGHAEDVYSLFIGCVLQGYIPTILPPLTTKQNPALFRSQMEELFTRIDPAAVITNERCLESVPQTSVPMLMAEAIETLALDTFGDLVAGWKKGVGRDDIAFLQHSSGTTRAKKGVMITHSKALEHVNSYAPSIEIGTGDTIVSWLPLYHDMGLIACLLLPSVVGCPIVSLDAFEWVANPTMLFDFIESEGGKYVWLPNFAFHHMARGELGDKRWNVSSLKAIINCSEPCRSAAFDVFLGRFASLGIERSKLQVSYAMAENVFAVTQTRVGNPVRAGRGNMDRYLSCGPAIPGVEIEIRGESGASTSGELGEIWIRTTSMFSGYYKLEDFAAESIADGWYNTRDLGVLVDGELYVLGRVDDLLIVHGKNVIAHELEDAINPIAGVAPGRVLVFSTYNEDVGSDEMIILLEPNGSEDDFERIKKDVRSASFAATGVFPKEVHVVASGFLVKSTSGKISRKSSVSKFNAEGMGTLATLDLESHTA